MTPVEAARILELSPDATPDQVEARFHELRTRLEEKIGKAPTPGLKAKYRESLAEITTAFETLTLARDASALPVLQRQSAKGEGPSGGGRQEPANAGSPLAGGPPGARPQGPALQQPHTSNPAPRTSRRSGGREFALVATIAVVLLAVGGWFVIKTRAENAEKARIAAEAKAEAERQAEAARQAAEEKRRADEAKRQAAEEEKARAAAAKEAERERQDKLLTTLRSRLAELNVAYEAAMRAEQVAERELAERKSQERELKGALTPQARRVAAEVAAQAALVDWLRTNLPEHPARVAKARADELIAARAPDEAAAAVAAYAAAVEQLKADIADRRQANVVTGRVGLTSNLDEVTWTLTDAFGVEHTGRTPATPEDIAFGPARVVFTHPRQPAREGTLTVSAAALARMHAEFPVGTLAVRSNLAGTTWKLTDALGIERTGTTPADVSEIAPGAAAVLFSHPGWPGLRQTVEIAAAGQAQATATFAPSVLTVHVTPADAAVTVEGVTRQADGSWMLMPGEHVLRATKAGLGPQWRVVTAGVNQPITLEIALQPELGPRIAALLEQMLVQPGQPKEIFVETAWSLATLHYYTGDREKYRALIRACLPRLGELYYGEKWAMVTIALRASLLGLTEEARPLLTDGLDYEEISKYSGEKPQTIINIGAQKAAFNLVMGNGAKARTILAAALSDSRSADRWQHKINGWTFDEANDRTNAETLYRGVYDHLMTLSGDQFPETAQQYLASVPAEHRAKVADYAPGASVWSHVLIKFKRGDIPAALRSWELAVENQHAANVRYKAKESRVFNNTLTYLRTVLDFGHPEAVEPIRALADRLIANGKMLPHPQEEQQPLIDPMRRTRHAADLSAAQFTRFADLEKSPDPKKLISLWIELRRYGLSR